MYICTYYSVDLKGLINLYSLLVFLVVYLKGKENI